MASGYSPYEEQNILNDVFSRTSANQHLRVSNISSFQIPLYDYIVLTYVSAGNGEGEIETVVYKDGGSGGTTVATLTIAYNSDNEITSVTKS